MNTPENVPADEPDDEFRLPEDGMWAQARLLVPGIRLLEGGPLGPWRPICSAHTREPEGHRPGVTQLILTGSGSPDSRRRFHQPDDELAIQRPDLSDFPVHAEQEAPDILARIDGRLTRIGAQSMSLTPREEHAVAYYLTHTAPVMALDDAPAARVDWHCRAMPTHDLLANYAAQRRWIAAYRHLAALADKENTP